jgi:hypothetical protein
MSYGHDRAGRGGAQLPPGGREAGGVPGKRTLTEALAVIAYPHAAQIAAATGVSLPGRAVVDLSACEDRGVPAFTDIGPDDTISNLRFAAPYAPQVDNRPWDGAEYHTHVKFER